MMGVTSTCGHSGIERTCFSITTQAESCVFDMSREERIDQELIAASLPCIEKVRIDQELTAVCLCHV